MRPFGRVSTRAHLLIGGGSETYNITEPFLLLSNSFKDDLERLPFPVVSRSALRAPMVSNPDGAANSSHMQTRQDSYPIGQGDEEGTLPDCSKSPVRMMA
jgi:hypothetical protein